MVSLRNVIYYNDNANQIPLAGIAGLSYTDIIIGFLAPGSDGNTLIGVGDAFDDDNFQSSVKTLQNAHKNVLVSIGGASKTFPSLAWQNYARNVEGLVGQIVEFVTGYGLDGVDIDYEDDAGFGNTPTYDGVGFLVQLTNGLYQALLPYGRNIITHAPQTPYWDSNSEYAKGGIAPYAAIWQQVGHQVAWINNQFYNDSGYDQDAATKVNKYRAVAGITGGPQKLLVGAIFVGTDSNGDPIDGYIPLDQMINNVIAPLKATFGSQFGGVTGWEFSHDQGGTWANGIGQALKENHRFSEQTPHPASRSVVGAAKQPREHRTDFRSL